MLTSGLYLLASLVNSDHARETQGSELLASIGVHSPQGSLVALFSKAAERVKQLSANGGIWIVVRPENSVSWPGSRKAIFRRTDDVHSLGLLPFACLDEVTMYVTQTRTRTRSTGPGL